MATTGWEVRSARRGSEEGGSRVRSSLYANLVAHSGKLTEGEKLTRHSTLPVCRRFYRLTNSLTIILFGKLVHEPRNEKSALMADVDEVPRVFVTDGRTRRAFAGKYLALFFQTPQ